MCPYGPVLAAAAAAAAAYLQAQYGLRLGCGGLPAVCAAPADTAGR